LLAVIGAVLGFLALGAMVQSGWLLLRWDRPIQRFVESNRGEDLNAFFLTASRFGSTFVVLALGAVLSAVSWTRCRAVAIALVVATLSRPAIEFVLKLVVSRDRPDFDRLVHGTGYSFPSGHVMAAVALWGMLPVVVGLFTRSRALWWASAVFSAGMILAIAASRVYLGVHWTSDVVAGLLVGTFFLLGMDWILHRSHAFSGCDAARRREGAAPTPAS
jgi:undecaprenyl-diphosphatase